MAPFMSNIAEDAIYYHPGSDPVVYCSLQMWGALGEVLRIDRLDLGVPSDLGWLPIHDQGRQFDATGFLLSQHVCRMWNKIPC